MQNTNFSKNPRIIILKDLANQPPTNSPMGYTRVVCIYKLQLYYKELFAQ